MGHELITLFCGGVQADRVVHLIVGAIRHLLVTAVNGRRGSVHQVFHGIMPASLQDIVEAKDVGLDIGVRVGDGITNPGLGGQVHHHSRVVLLKNAGNQVLVRQIALDKGPARVGLFVSRFPNLTQPVFFDGDIVIVVDAVQADEVHLGHFFQQAKRQVRTDKAGSTGDEDGFVC